MLFVSPVSLQFRGTDSKVAIKRGLVHYVKEVMYTYPARLY